MEFPRWKNQYIDLVRTKPRYIIPFTDQSGHEVAQALQERIRSFEKIVIELGSGSGGHLIGQAERDPRTLFIGFELRFKRIFRTAEKAEKAGLQNILIIQWDARRLQEIFQSSSIDGIYVNFPDPWDHTRWKKHRLLNEATLSSMARCLREGGFLSYKTDHQEYFTEILTSLRQEDPLFTVTKFSHDLYSTPDILDGDNVRTEFEQLFRFKNKPIFYLEARRLERKALENL